MTSPEEPFSSDSLTERIYLKRLELVNLKSFPKLVFELSENPVVVIGSNNSGKTSLQWACLLFIHAFNSRSTMIQKSNLSFPVDIREDMAELIVSPTFSGPSPDYGSFVRFGEKETVLIGTFGELTIRFIVKANAVMEIQNASVSYLVNIRKSDLVFLPLISYFRIRNQKFLALTISLLLLNKIYDIYGLN